MHFMFWHGHIDWGGGETGGGGGGVGWKGGVVVGVGWGGVDLSLVLLCLSSNLRASLFCALSRSCQCLVTLPSLMAFLCSIYAPPPNDAPPPPPPCSSLPPAQPSLSCIPSTSLPFLPTPPPPLFFYVEPPSCAVHSLPPLALINTLYSPLSTLHVTHIWPQINYGWGPLTSHLKFLLCLSMDDRYFTSPHPQSCSCFCLCPTFIAGLFYRFLFVYDFCLLEVLLVSGSLGL